MDGMPEVIVRRNGWFLRGVELGPTRRFSNQPELGGPLFFCLKIKHNVDLLSSVPASPTAHGDFPRV
jgi:hypothetical protein